MSEKLETQISGKYSKEEPRLFDFKKSMEEANIKVNYPAGDGVIEDKQDFAITHDSELNRPFHETEIDFLKSIKDTPIHVVFNLFKDKEGYIGESASIEIAYALAHNKPMVLLRNPVFAEGVPVDIRDIITEKIDKISILGLDSLSPAEIEKFLQDLTRQSVDYELSSEQKKTCMRYITILLKSKRRDWKNKD